VQSFQEILRQEILRQTGPLMLQLQASGMLGQQPNYTTTPQQPNYTTTPQQQPGPSTSELPPPVPFQQAVLPPTPVHQQLNRVAGESQATPIELIDVHVAAPVRASILQHEAVDFKSLLEDDPSQQPAARDKSKTPLSSQQWLAAWAIYAKIYLEQYPEEGPWLMVHMYQIQKLMEEKADWRGYDITVRRLIQHRRQGWGEPNGNLRLDARTRRPPQQGGSRLEIPSGECINFHKGSGCTRNPCKYSHKCFRCGKGEHPAIQCHTFPIKGGQPFRGDKEGAGESAGDKRK
jgi:hypothetical protein